MKGQITGEGLGHAGVVSGGLSGSCWGGVSVVLGSCLGGAKDRVWGGVRAILGSCQGPCWGSVKGHAGGVSGPCWGHAGGVLAASRDKTPLLLTSCLLF